MEILQIALMIISMTSGMATVALQIVAYTKREDKSFWGGANILNGWFLFFLYGKNGLPKKESELVFWCRVTSISTLAFGYLAVLCRS